MKLEFRELERRLNAGLGEDETLELKPQLFENKKGFRNDILKGVVALANARGGHLIIGVEQEKGNWVICGTNYDEEHVRNWLSQIVYEYVEPDNLPFKVYPIRSTENNLKCVVIEVDESKERYFAIRYWTRRSKKDTSYYLPLRFSESSRFLDFQSFFRKIISTLATGLSVGSKKLPFSGYTFIEEREFNLVKFKLRIAELKEIKKIGDPKTESMIRTELLDSLPNLPQNDLEPWTSNLRNTTLELIDLLVKEFKTTNEPVERNNLRMLNHIAYRADEITLERIKHNFLDKLERVYANPKAKKSSDLIRLLQILHYNQPDYTKKMIEDAIERWSATEFESIYNDIDIDRYLWKDNKRLEELRLFILTGLAIARKSKDMQKVARFGKVYIRIRSK